MMTMMSANSMRWGQYIQHKHNPTRCVCGSDLHRHSYTFSGVTDSGVWHHQQQQLNLTEILWLGSWGLPR